MTVPDHESKSDADVYVYVTTERPQQKERFDPKLQAKTRYFGSKTFIRYSCTILKTSSNKEKNV